MNYLITATVLLEDGSNIKNKQTLSKISEFEALEKMGEIADQVRSTFPYFISAVFMIFRCRDGEVIWEPLFSTVSTQRIANVRENLYRFRRRGESPDPL